MSSKSSRPYIPPYNPHRNTSKTGEYIRMYRTWLQILIETQTRQSLIRLHYLIKRKIAIVALLFAHVAKNCQKVVKKLVKKVTKNLAKSVKIKEKLDCNLKI